VMDIDMWMAAAGLLGAGLALLINRWVSGTFLGAWWFWLAFSALVFTFPTWRFFSLRSERAKKR